MKEDNQLSRPNSMPKLIGMAFFFSWSSLSENRHIACHHRTSIFRVYDIVVSACGQGFTLPCAIPGRDIIYRSMDQLPFRAIQFNDRPRIFFQMPDDPLVVVSVTIWSECIGDDRLEQDKYLDLIIAPAAIRGN